MLLTLSTVGIEKGAHGKVFKLFIGVIDGPICDVWNLIHKDKRAQHWRWLVIIWSILHKISKFSSGNSFRWLNYPLLDIFIHSTLYFRILIGFYINNRHNLRCRTTVSGSRSSRLEHNMNIPKKAAKVNENYHFRIRDSSRWKKYAN